jgi:Pyridine nucleotide-disulphide oxidoreductase, dimerisation domain
VRARRSAYALGPEAGERLQQATLAIRAHIPLDVLADTIKPFPTFSEVYVGALKAPRSEVAAAFQGARGATADGKLTNQERAHRAR